MAAYPMTVTLTRVGFTRGPLVEFVRVTLTRGPLSFEERLGLRRLVSRRIRELVPYTGNDEFLETTIEARVAKAADEPSAKVKWQLPDLDVARVARYSATGVW